jgi:DNA-binding MarR family transcriptional regulator
MARDIDPSERNPTERPGTERNIEPPRDVAPRQAPSRERQLLAGRHYAYHVSRAELETMYDIGRFRTIAVEDLARQRYNGNTGQLRQDLRSLADQGLIQRRTIWTDANRERLDVIVLTKQGRQILEREPGQTGQALYAGFVKPAEVRHDAAIYRMFQAEAGQIEKAGGRIRRVVLDYELKQKL